jgi:hypothetical protein
MIPFDNTQHFFLTERRPTNRLNGKVTSHPFACLAIGYEPSESKLPFRVAISICHPKDHFTRKSGSNRANGLLQSVQEGKEVHAAWVTPSQIKSLSKLFELLGVKEQINARALNSPRASKSLKNIILDLQGIRFEAPKTRSDRVKANVKSGMTISEATVRAI